MFKSRRFDYGTKGLCPTSTRGFDMKSRKHFICISILSLLLFGGCATRIEVTHEVVETLGHEMLSNFRFYLSKDITLRRIVMVGEYLELTAPGVVMVTNLELRLRSSKIGRFQKEIPPDRLEISFEEIPSENRPFITFVQQIVDGQERYHIETTRGTGWIVDVRGKYGYIKMEGDIVAYKGLYYFLVYEGEEKPYLIQELDVKVAQEIRDIQGIK
jgi:hypothetical protein